LIECGECAVRVTEIFASVAEFDPKIVVAIAECDG
jgi:hypothetical protein